MRREAIALIVAMTAGTPAAALNAPTLAAGKGGEMRVERGYVDVKKPARRTDFEESKSRQRWQDIPLPENITRRRATTVRA